MNLSNHKTIQCGVCKNPYRIGALQYRKCPRPKVNEKYGKYICSWCCLKCKYGYKEQYATFYAIGCRYDDELNKEV
ncbi:MAG: hypothetical protein ACI4Q8_05875 [Ruminococcus sp.]